MTAKVRSFSEIQDAFFAYISDIGYATMITVDKKGRPRARVLLPIWEMTGDRPVGWLAAYKTPVKVAHLANNPHTTFSYWNPRQNAVFIDGVATWVDDPEVKRTVWESYRKGEPPGVGYDPVRYWRGGPTDPEYHVLRVDPWRVQLVRGTDLGSTIWQAEGTA
ncbi:pyridoxamine 5'-phosphate oxidase family protein [Actinomadura alba]|uniref:Pyridoxamine 5'-phosphate oxidase family protein n=1 Tax=Actinomadura alba TaxID=406431 RepID=A0ABR7M1K6_9ACTN|nr:pyridoxamine 5'-phosphate oxidase family protein [Actinomadura alba]MBC6470473.1 pyridoxamine 5'-phosphate oxidase family protein [Actinomadura alba]